MFGKKAQEMSTNTIILLILGLIILIALIWGFATGFSGFKQIISPTNVDSIVEACATSCSLNNKFDYCSGERVLRVNEERLEIKTSCYIFANLPQFKRYGIQSCPAVNCDLSCENVRINDKAGSSSLDSGTYDLSELVSEEKCFI